MNEPSRLGYLDCSTGVSGDKFLGALLDVGSAGAVFTEVHLQEILDHLAVEARVNVSRVVSRGVSALSVRVDATDQPTHRSWADIRLLIESSSLPDAVREKSLSAFEVLARAEADVHGETIDDIHFHEVGALDSILDVVGVCAGVHALELDEIVASPVATGWGTVDTSHGVLPVPAPATATLLLGVPVTPGPSRRDGSAPGELTTPTGAALLSALVSAYGPCPPLTPILVGYGAGTRDIGNPNVCRLTVGVRESHDIPLERQPVGVLETNVDHLSPEAVAWAAEQLLAEGAFDVWTTPIVMKKGRSAVTLCVLVGGGACAGEHFAQRIVALTGTLGVRVTELERYEAPRANMRIDTPYGPVGVKQGPEGANSRLRPEADDVARIARETLRSFTDVHRELTALVEQALDKNGQR
ncbi:MAG: TIGR00299 family protein [Actinobacteria bacterium HGW-Actinobacteria-7]|jgi:hypothetical protein|nr:MAG: TIGR00299 family protein [Actinobacteria bacterium HGW-Actinobacteria-7]